VAVLRWNMHQFFDSHISLFGGVLGFAFFFFLCPVGAFGLVYDIQLM
jgi:hypothetical protein